MLDEVLPKIVKSTPQIDWGIADTRKCPRLSKRFKIESIPQILFYRNGRKLGRIDGFLGYAETQEWIIVNILDVRV
jgi:thioredoxin-related protein